VTTETLLGVAMPSIVAEVPPPVPLSPLLPELPPAPVVLAVPVASEPPQAANVLIKIASKIVAPVFIDRVMPYLLDCVRPRCVRTSQSRRSFLGTVEHSSACS
jgi:hypothetical protein